MCSASLRRRIGGVAARVGVWTLVCLWATTLGGPRLSRAASILVSDYTTSKILRYDAATGAFQGAFATTNMNGPVTVASGPGNNLYVANELLPGNVTRYDGTTGSFIDAFIPNGSGGLDSAHGLTFGPDGNLYVSSQDPTDLDVKRYDGTTGAFIGVFVPVGSGGVFPPLDLLFGPNGDLYVASRDTNEVLRFDGVTGAFVGVAASGGGLTLPVAQAFGPDGNLYVSSWGTNQVLRYHGSTGAFIDVFASGGGMVAPNNLVFGPDGNLYVGAEGTGVVRFNGTTGAFIDTVVPLGAGGLTRPVSLTITAEPASVAMAVLGLAGLLGMSRLLLKRAALRA